VAAEDDKSPRPFDVRLIKTLVALMKQHDLSEVDLNEGDHRIRIRRGAKAATVADAAPAAPPPAPAAHPAPTPAAPTPPAEPAKPAKNLIPIKSPTPGTFYTSPSPDAPQFVTVGSRVTPSTVVCVIEAMKIFNEIQAECSGVIAEVLVQNQQPVEWGQVLFNVDPAG